MQGKVQISPCHCAYTLDTWVPASRVWHLQTNQPCTMRFGSTAKVLLKCKLKYYRISECLVDPGSCGFARRGHGYIPSSLSVPQISRCHTRLMPASWLQQTETRAVHGTSTTGLKAPSLHLQVDKDSDHEPDSAPTSSGTPDLKIIETTPPEPGKDAGSTELPDGGGASPTGLARNHVPDPTHPDWDANVRLPAGTSCIAWTGAKVPFALTESKEAVVELVHSHITGRCVLAVPPGS